MKDSVGDMRGDILLLIYNSVLRSMERDRCRGYTGYLHEVFSSKWFDSVEGLYCVHIRYMEYRSLLITALYSLTKGGWKTIGKSVRLVWRHVHSEYLS